MTGGPRVLSNGITVRIMLNPGKTFLDRMIALLEGVERQKTPNKMALNVVLVGLTVLVHAGGGVACALCALQCGCLGYGTAPRRSRADRAAGVPDSNNCRGTALDHRASPGWTG